MSTIIEMMDDIDGVKPGEIRYDGHGNPEPLPTARERAESLFSALDKDNDGCLTKAQCYPTSLVEVQRGPALIGRVLLAPKVLCHKESAHRI